MLSEVINQSASGATSQNFPAVNCDQIYGMSYIARFSDATSSGTVKFQVSGDAPQPQNFAFAPTNWVDLPNSSQTVTAGGSVTYNAQQFCYEWIRVVYTRGAGAGTVSVDLKSVGV